MRTNSIRLFGSLLFFAFAFTACQKELKHSSTSASISNNLAGGGGNKIKLFAAETPVGTDVFTYNDAGLLDEWRFGEVPATYKHEYDSKGRLVRVWVREEDFPPHTRVDFFYNQQGERYLEKWYDGISGILMDEVVYTFSNDVVKSESVTLSTVILSYLDNNGNVSSVEAYFGGRKFLSWTYTYNNHLKNPYNAIPGIDYAYQLLGGVIFRNKWYRTSQTFTAWDGDGNISFQLAQDPDKVQVTAGPENYVQTANFWEIGAQTYSNFSFNYADCGQCSTTITKSSNSRLEQIMRATIKDGRQSIAEKLKALLP